MNKSWWLIIMPLKFTKFISYGTFIAFDGVQILLLNNFMSIYLLVIKNWSVWVLAFIPYHGMQNCDAVYFFKKRLKRPMKRVPFAQSSHMALKPALCKVQGLKDKEKRRKETSRQVTFLHCFLHRSLQSKGSWLDSQLTLVKASAVNWKFAVKFIN